MNKKIENNTYKKRPAKRVNCPGLNIIDCDINTEIYQGKPFTAWPGNITANAGKNFRNDVIGGRTKSGGYVAYPTKGTGK
ncbi:hypothetical protein FW778_11475 [Ginsengibacter hankyongi]|uniref:Uncharacterized protein n=1 Tax=Ginsengibacter hankyongi TaxID=2607284 RepID=A0A5J5IGY2_9BACT|nr:hypothetical protein [Ginsengibacter hankyongi]KAA9039435.1 hypothetical protein FW778_11475 [Ginsengibacter hankyongi]